MNETGMKATRSEVELLLQAIRKRWMIFTVLLACSVLIGVGIAIRMKDVYEATTLLKLGQVATVVGNDQVVFRLVESAESIEAQAPVWASAIHVADPDEQALIQRSLLVKRIPPSDIIELKVRASSEKRASEVLSSVTENVAEKHRRMMIPTTDNSAQNLESLRQILRKSKEYFERCALTSPRSSENRLIFLGEDCFTEELKFENRKAALEEAARAERTYTTHMLGGITSSKAPTMKIMVLGLAFLMGLMIALTSVVFLERAMFRRHE